MTLKEFIEKFIEPNTTIRLWLKIKGGHQVLHEVEMEHFFVKSNYADREVLYITDILTPEYCEAVNIVLKDNTNGKWFDAEETKTRKEHRERMKQAIKKDVDYISLSNRVIKNMKNK